MSSTIVFFLFIPLLSLILLTINIIFAPRNPYIEKNNAFECGFTSFIGQNRMQFSISFFIFALLFLLFDLEILLVYPYLISAYVNETYGLLILMTFLGVLTIGFIFELGKKALTIDSRQTVLSNHNLIKKSLSKIPYTTIFANSMLFKSLYRGSVLLNKNLNVKYVNFHTSLSLYTKDQKKYLSKVITSATKAISS
jgi:NADH-ubiquinone oxidoreductase chain 3